MCYDCRRLRKKAYIEELKRSVQELTAARDWEARSQTIQVQRKIELESVRLQVIERFLLLRSEGSRDVNQWHTILDESFVLRTGGSSATALLAAARALGSAAEKNTNSNATSASPAVVAGAPFGQQMSDPMLGSAILAAADERLRGVPLIFSELADLDQLLNSIGRGSPAYEALRAPCLTSEQREQGRVRLVYSLDRREAAVADSALTAAWRADTVNAVRNGARSELCMTGAARCDEITWY